MPSPRSDGSNFNSFGSVRPTRQASNESQADTGGGKSARAASPRILIVEDDYLAATEAEAALADAGYDVVGPATSANEAVRLARSERPALVIMDIRLSGKRDGVDAAKEILEATGVRCIFATAHNMREMRERAAVASPLGWLPKPYGTEALLGAVKAAIVELKP